MSSIVFYTCALFIVSLLSVAYIGSGDMTSFSGYYYRTSWVYIKSYRFKQSGCSSSVSFYNVFGSYYIYYTA